MVYNESLLLDDGGICAFAFFRVVKNIEISGIFRPVFMSFVDYVIFIVGVILNLWRNQQWLNL